MTIECRAGGIQLRSVLKLSGLESITIDFQNLAFGKPSAVLINSLRIGSNQFDLSISLLVNLVIELFK